MGAYRSLSAPTTLRTHQVDERSGALKPARNEHLSREENSFFYSAFAVKGFRCLEKSSVPRSLAHMGKNVMYLLRWTLIIWLLIPTPVTAQQTRPFRVLALAESGSIHQPFVLAAKNWLDQLGREEAFTVDYITTTDRIDSSFLSQYPLFIQLDYPPYRWTDRAKMAFIDYIEQGRGGWIGFHHATLLGEFDGYAIWPWFSQFMGGIRYKDYIASFVTATVRVENRQHPIMRGVPASFTIEREEWYTYDKSPRPSVDVLAAVDESTYRPDSPKKMGDHPVIWSNPHVRARNVYFFMGHHPDLFQHPAYTTMVRNAIRWAAQPLSTH